jgi:hypothetical protein
MVRNTFGVVRRHNPTPQALCIIALGCRVFSAATQGGGFGPLGNGDGSWTPQAGVLADQVAGNAYTRRLHVDVFNLGGALHDEAKARLDLFPH